MRTFLGKRPIAQGELYIRRVDRLPDGVVEVAPVNGHVIVGHSETGHHHVMDAARTTMYRLPEEIYECFLVVSEADALTHLRAFATHEPILHPPGVYQVRRGREYVPEGWRPQQD
jgi:hypothetical protein